MNRPAWWMCSDTCELFRSPCWEHQTRAICELKWNKDTSRLLFKEKFPLKNKGLTYEEHSPWRGRSQSCQTPCLFHFWKWPRKPMKSFVIKRINHLNFEFLCGLLHVPAIAVLAPTVSCVGHFELFQRDFLLELFGYILWHLGVWYSEIAIQCRSFSYDKNPSTFCVSIRIWLKSNNSGNFLLLNLLELANLRHGLLFQVVADGSHPHPLGHVLLHLERLEVKKKEEGEKCPSLLWRVGSQKK